MSRQNKPPVQPTREDSRIDLEEIDVAPKHRRKVEALLRNNENLFAKSDLDLGTTQTVKMTIDSVPCYSRQKNE